MSYIRASQGREGDGVRRPACRLAGLTAPVRILRHLFLLRRSHFFRCGSNGAKVGLRWAVGLAAALFPILHRVQLKTEATHENCACDKPGSVQIAFTSDRVRWRQGARKRRNSAAPCANKWRSSTVGTGASTSPLLDMPSIARLACNSAVPHLARAMMAGIVATLASPSAGRSTRSSGEPEDTRVDGLDWPRRANRSLDSYLIALVLSKTGTPPPCTDSTIPTWFGARALGCE